MYVYVCFEYDELSVGNCLPVLESAFVEEYDDLVGAFLALSTSRLV